MNDVAQRCINALNGHNTTLTGHLRLLETLTLDLSAASANYDSARLKLLEDVNATGVVIKDPVTGRANQDYTNRYIDQLIDEDPECDAAKIAHLIDNLDHELREIKIQIGSVNRDISLLNAILRLLAAGIQVDIPEDVENRVQLDDLPF